MQIRAKGNKYLAKRLIPGNLKNLSSNVEILEAHMSPYCLTLCFCMLLLIFLLLSLKHTMRKERKQEVYSNQKGE